MLGGTLGNLLNAHSAPGNAFFNVLTCVPCRAFILRGCKLPRTPPPLYIYGKSIQHTPRVGGAPRLCISLRQGQMGPMFLRQNAARRKREENSRGADLKWHFSGAQQAIPAEHCILIAINYNMVGKKVTQKSLISHYWRLRFSRLPAEKTRCLTCESALFVRQNSLLIKCTLMQGFPTLFSKAHSTFLSAI